MWYVFHWKYKSQSVLNCTFTLFTLTHCQAGRDSGENGGWVRNVLICELQYLKCTFRVLKISQSNLWKNCVRLLKLIWTETVENVSFSWLRSDFPGKEKIWTLCTVILLITTSNLVDIFFLLKLPSHCLPNEWKLPLSHLKMKQRPLNSHRRLSSTSAWSPNKRVELEIVLFSYDIIYI